MKLNMGSLKAKTIGHNYHIQALSNDFEFHESMLNLTMCHFIH